MYYKAIENTNLKKSNIEIENQREIEKRYMFLLKTLDILTKIEENIIKILEHFQENTARK